MSERTVHQRMADAIADMGPIAKGRSSGVNYEFRGIDAVMNALHPILAKHGLTLAPKVWDDWQVNMLTDSKGRSVTQALFRVSVMVRGADGDELELGPGLAQSHDYGDKAVYQAQQNAIKYVLLESFCIPTHADEDMDGRAAPDLAPITEEVPAFDVKGWAADAVQMFTEWSDERRKSEWKVAAEAVLDGKPRTQAEAQKVVDAMANAYYDEHPADAGRPF